MLKKMPKPNKNLSILMEMNNQLRNSIVYKESRCEKEHIERDKVIEIIKIELERDKKHFPNIHKVILKRIIRKIMEVI